MTDSHDRDDGGEPGNRPDVLTDIPWERFTERPGFVGRHHVRWVVAAAGVIGLVGVGWFLARSLITPQTNEPVSAAATTPPSSPVTTPTVVTTPTSQPVPSTVATYKDLSVPMDRQVVTLAEWYVRLYLTDPESLGLPPPRRPRYVEWAVTRSVNHVGEGRVDVEVLTQSLVETEDGFQREKTRLVTVPLMAGDEGWVVEDRPSQVRTVALEIADPPKTEQPLPPDIKAKTANSMKGKVTGGGRVGDRWRVELRVNGLPIAVEVDDEGRRVASSPR